MKFNAIILCLALVSPSAAQMRSAAGVARIPAAGSFVPALGADMSKPALSLAPTLSLTPSLSAAPSLAPLSAPAAAPVVAAQAVALAPVAAAVGVAAQPSAQPAAQAVPSALVNPDAPRAASEQFWSGSSAKPALESAPVSAPSLPAWTAPLVPYAEGAAVIGGAYAANRAVKWGIDKIAAKRGWQKNTVATWRFISTLAVWGGAGAIGLSLAGISGSVLAETFGVGGAAMALAISLAVKDVAGNLFHGVHFLLSRPYTIGDKVTVGKTTAVVRDLTLRYVVLTGEDGRDILRTHASLAAAPVTLYGTYKTKELRLKLRKPALPHGLFRALRDAAAAPSLWKPVALSAATITALAFFPMLGGFAAAKSLTWVAAALPYVKAGLVAFLANSISNTLSRSIGRLGERYSWNPAVVTVAKLGASVATWVVGGSFLLNAVGVSWGWVMKTLSLGGALMSIAVVDYGTAIFNAIVVFKLKPFEIGDENISIGEHTGTVVDITWQNVVLKLDEDRYIIIPHSVVKDAEIKNPRKYGQRAETQKDK